MRMLAFLMLLFFALFVGATLMGCHAVPEYQAVPAWLIPMKPVVPTVRADQLSCLADETYTALAERDRACWQYARELRALLGPEHEQR